MNTMARIAEITRQRRADVNVEYVLLMVVAALAVILGLGYLAGVMNGKHISLADALWGKGIPSLTAGSMADGDGSGSGSESEGGATSGIAAAPIYYTINYGGSCTVWCDADGTPTYSLIENDTNVLVANSDSPTMTINPTLGGFEVRIDDSTPSSTETTIVNGFWAADIHVTDLTDGTIRVYSNNTYGFTDFSLYRDGIEIATGGDEPSFITPYLLGVHVYEIRDGKAICSQQTTTNRSVTLLAFGNNVSPDFSQVIRGDGSTWLNQGTASVVNSVMPYSMSHALAVNHNTVFAVGARLAKTTNGGASWTVSALPFNPTYAMDNISQSADKSTLWMSGQFGYIYKSTDEGVTWTNKSVGGTQGMFGIAALDANTAYAAGGGGLIYKTTTGGNSWVAQTSGTTSSLNAGAAAADANTVWVAGASGTIRKTTNGGTTWVGQTSGTTATLYKLAVVDANTAWVVGSGGVIRKTTNGGTTWVGQPSGTTANLLDVVALDANTAYAVGSSGICLATTDGGSTWTRLTIMSGAGMFGTWTKNLVAVTAF